MFNRFTLVQHSPGGWKGGVLNISTGYMLSSSRGFHAYLHRRKDNYVATITSLDGILICLFFISWTFEKSRKHNPATNLPAFRSKDVKFDLTFRPVTSYNLSMRIGWKHLGWDCDGVKITGIFGWV